MRVGSLFSGALDGLSLGLEWAGMRTVWQVEKDDWRRAQLTRLYPHARQYGDIHGLDPEQLDPVDLICGGFPCQPWSCAGRQKGRGDDRDLWPQMRRIIAACRPGWVLGENVPGLDDKRFLALDGVLSDLEGLGYEAVPFEVPASAVNAPHQRARIFIVAHAGGQRRQQDARGPHGHEAAHERRATEHDHQPAGDGQGCEDVEHSAESRQKQRGSAEMEEGWVRARGGEFERRGGNGCNVAYSGQQGFPVSQQSREPVEEKRGVCPGAAVAQRGGPLGAWDDFEWIVGADGKARRVKPGVRLLAHGVPDRSAWVSAFGDAVIPQVAYMFGVAIREAAL